MSESTETTSNLMPVLFVPHGGGPMPLMNEPNHRELTQFMSRVAADIAQPNAILMITAHWEESVATVSSGAAPAMMYDYQGFPPETYRYQYPAPGNPQLAQQIIELLQAQGIKAKADPMRGFDHGTFVPLMLMYPQATIPVVQLSLLDSFDPVAHIALGEALAVLREQGVLIIGSGMSFHNMRAFFSGDPATQNKSAQFDEWLTHVLVDDIDNVERCRLLSQWQQAPQARFSHPREEHLLPLYVCFGAAHVASSSARKIFSSVLLGSQVSAFLWL